MKYSTSLSEFRGLGAALARFLEDPNPIGRIRSLSPMPDRAQRVIDTAVVEVGLDRLAIYADILAEGLVYPLKDWLSAMELYWESIGRSGGAHYSMMPNTRGEDHLAERTGHRIPIYATWDKFSLNIRALRASQRVGVPLDTSEIKQTVRSVNEGIEYATINGPSIQVAGATVPGLLTAPNANTYAYAGGEAWNAAGKTGDEIVSDVQAMADILIADRKFGPYNLYIPSGYQRPLNSDYKSNGDKLVSERIEQLQFGNRGIRIRVADMLPANRTALVQMTSDVVDVVDGQTPTTLSWSEGAGFELDYMVIACQVARFKTDSNGASGVCLGYTS